jgi:hypothetical protein
VPTPTTFHTDLNCVSRFGLIGVTNQIAGFTALIFGKSQKMKISTQADFEQVLKWFALALGLCSTIAIVQGWQLAAMLFGLPFCLIWIYCGWLRTERQLKYINIMFSALYIYGIARYFMLDA